jgi:hypothetical protein
MSFTRAELCAVRFGSIFWVAHSSDCCLSCDTIYTVSCFGRKCCLYIQDQCWSSRHFVPLPLPRLQWRHTLENNSLNPYIGCSCYRKCWLWMWANRQLVCGRLERCWEHGIPMERGCWHSSRNSSFQTQDWSCGRHRAHPWRTSADNSGISSVSIPVYLVSSEFELNVILFPTWRLSAFEFFHSEPWLVHYQLCNLLLHSAGMNNRWKEFCISLLWKLSCGW